MKSISQWVPMSFALAAALLVHAAASGAKDQPAPGVGAADVQRCLPAGRIHVGGEIGRRMTDCMENLVTAWDLDRLIGPFRDKTDGKPSGGFPDHWRCDYWGKWFTALAWGYAHQPTTEHRRLMDRAVAQLIATQGPDGDICSFAGEKRLNGGYDVWGRQCVILGLVAYYDLTADKTALDAACRELDCLMKEVEQKKVRIPDLGWPMWKGLAPSVAVESGALLFQRTGLSKYRDFSQHIAAQWNEPGKLAPNGLRLVDDALAGKPAREVGAPKGYEQLVCFIGICELYRATGNRKYLDAAVALAKNIRAEELFVTGTGTRGEVWFKGRTQQTQLLKQPAETCVTAHWMYLCWSLLRLTGDPAYADEMELSLDNALLGALMPDGRWWGYYNPLMGERAPSWVHQADAGLSCCVVSGSRALMLTPFWAAMQAKDGPVLNLYFSGTVEARTASSGGVSLTIDTDYPRAGAVRLSVKPLRPETFTVALRIPAWSQTTTLKINGQPQSVQPGRYATIRRLWADGDRIELTLDMRTRILDAPDGNGQVALMRGPIVLALDERLTPPEKDALAALPRNAAALADVKPNVQAAEKAGVWMAFDVPLLINGKPRTLTMCDYASAGNRWSGANRFRTWLPQPLNLGTAYETGATWKIVTSGASRPSAPAGPRLRKMKANRVLILGNSITLTPPTPAVDWSGNWGMAASAPEKDFVHIVTSALSKATGTTPEVMARNIAEFERQYAGYDVDGKFKEAFGFGADLVIIAIGENVPNLDSEAAKAQFGNSLMKVLRGLKVNKRPAIVVRSCFWPDDAKDQILKQACQEVGGLFVDISNLGKDESNYARSERKFSHNGVAAHPGDRGMQAIANAILEAIDNQRSKRTDK